MAPEEPALRIENGVRWRKLMCSRALSLSCDENQRKDRFGFCLGNEAKVIS